MRASSTFPASARSRAALPKPSDGLSLGEVGRVGGQADRQSADRREPALERAVAPPRRDHVRGRERRHAGREDDQQAPLVGGHRRSPHQISAAPTAYEATISGRLSGLWTQSTQLGARPRTTNPVTATSFRSVLTAPADRKSVV